MPHRWWATGARGHRQGDRAARPAAAAAPVVAADPAAQPRHHGMIMRDRAMIMHGSSAGPAVGPAHHPAMIMHGSIVVAADGRSRRRRIEAAPAAPGCPPAVQRGHMSGRRHTRPGGAKRRTVASFCVVAPSRVTVASCTQSRARAAAACYRPTAVTPAPACASGLSFRW